MEGASDTSKEIIMCKKSALIERNRNNDAEMGIVCAEQDEVLATAPVMNLKQRRCLKGHRGKILHFDWSPDKSHLVTAGQDGFAIVWNGFTGAKEILIQTTTPWVLACSYSPSTTLVACGGLEKQCSIYKVGSVSGTEDRVARISLPSKVVGQHNKYISNCSFFGSDQQLLTASADSTCALWDLEVKNPVQRFQGNSGEVFGLAINHRDPYKVFCSGSSNGTTSLWDVRSGRREMKFGGLRSGVNAVRFFPSGDLVAAAANDGIIHLYDLRADQEISTYTKPSIVFGASALDFSKSGRIMFAGYNDHTLRAWDVQKGTHLMLWQNHQDRVSNVMMSPDGTALGTCSWDGSMKILA